MAIKSIDSYVKEAGKNLAIAIYGEPGVGKTSFAAALGEKVLFVDCEGGLLSLQGVKGVATTDKILSMNQLRESLAEILAFDCDTVVLDGFNSLSTMILEEFLEDNDLEALGKPKPKPADKDKDKSDFGASYSNYARHVKNKLGALVNTLKDNGKSVIFVIHQKTSQATKINSDVVYNIVGTSLDKQTEAAVIEMVDILFHVEEAKIIDGKKIKKKRRTVEFAGTANGVKSKCRIPNAENVDKDCVSAINFVRNFRELGDVTTEKYRFGRDE